MYINVYKCIIMYINVYKRIETYINVYKCTKMYQNGPKLALEIDEVASLSKGEPHLEKSTGHPLSDLLL